MVAKIKLDRISYSYGDHQVLSDVTLDVPERAITSFFGPAQSGKTTLLRLINRLNDDVEGTHMSGTILLGGEDIYAPNIHLPSLRRRVGMVFALPLPLPGTIRDNITYGPRLAGIRDRETLDELVVQSLQRAALWDEVKDRLETPASELSGGQQQRLCIARSLALEPEVLLLDEPTSGLDPVSTSLVEQSLIELKKQYTIIIVPHNIQQAARISDYTAFFLMGQLIEHGPASRVFTTPADKRTEEYITGRFG
ncbi:MAG: phosphate ABC transporter ATP-binding protein [Anaerolineae bacterium]|nr:phosphate ABC transporter ATP-binding protein [Anaerolineae bacterium]